jgi:hypothetical protein
MAYDPKANLALANEIGSRINNTKFKAAGRYLLLGLFYEKVGADKSGVLYTLKDTDHMGFPSLYRLYMEMEDIFEHDFAKKFFDGWEHWQILCECTWFRPHIDAWRRELEVKIKGKALKAMMEEAESASSNSYQANKFLLQGGWKAKEDQAAGKRGRPSKQEIMDQAHAIAESASQIDDDMERLGIN